MKIKCLTKFLDGVIQFELDDQCTVSDEDGARFCSNGWAEDMDGKVPTAEPTGGATTLQVHNSTLATSSPTV
jgi:hypothetical protein